MAKTIEERAIESRRFHKDESFKTFNEDLTFRMDDWAYGYCQGVTEQKAKDKGLIDMLIRELYTSRAYHLGITGLDSHAEIVRKEKEGDCALIRGIDRTIKYVKEMMEE